MINWSQERIFCCQFNILNQNMSSMFIVSIAQWAISHDDIRQHMFEFRLIKILNHHLNRVGTFWIFSNRQKFRGVLEVILIIILSIMIHFFISLSELRKFIENYSLMNLLQVGEQLLAEIITILMNQ